LTNKKPGHSQS